ncbi:MAG: neutral/alkaline non-lysosomal ceramidase N-terminal domain-containing protein [bacterium]
MKMRTKILTAALFALVLQTALVSAQAPPELVESENAPMINMFTDAPPVIADVSTYPEDPYNDETVTVSARVYSDPNASSLPVRSVEFRYRFGDSAEWSRFYMLEIPEGGGVYTPAVTPPAGARRMLYTIAATDAGGNASLVVPPAAAVNPGAEADFLWVADADEADELVPAELDFLALGAARDSQNLYIVEKIQGKPDPGSLSAGGANFYFAPLIPGREGIASFLGGTANVLGYMPLAASFIGIPKSGMFNLKDVISGKRDLPKTGVKMTKGKDRLVFTVPLNDLGEGGEWVTGLLSGLFTTRGMAPVDASPFVRLVLRGGEISLRDASSRAPSPLRAGAAKFDITPPVGTPLAGYGDRVGEPSVGVHDPLTGAALVIESDGRLYCFVGLDFFYMRLDFYNDLARRLREAAGLPEPCLFVGASHSHHSSGALSPDLAILGGRFQPELFELTMSRIAAGVAEAHRNLQPAALGIGAARMEEGRFVVGNRRSDSGKVDAVIGVVKVDTPGGQPIATLFNLSGHPTGIASRTMLMSSDFVGPARDAIESRGGGVAVFFNASVGDHSGRCPGECPGDDFEKVRRTGEAMADYVIAARKTIPTAPKAEFTALSRWLILNRAAGAVTTEKALLVNDRFAFLTLPGEMFFDPFGATLAEQARSQGMEHLFILGLTNDGLGYMYPEELYYQRAYEASYSVFGPRMSGFLVDNAAALLSALAPPQ